MMQLSSYDPRERQREKHLARVQDDCDLREGRLSRDQLRARNGFFSSLDLAGSSVRRRRIAA